MNVSYTNIYGALDKYPYKPGESKWYINLKSAQEKAAMMRNFSWMIS